MFPHINIQPRQAASARQKKNRDPILPTLQSQHQRTHSSTGRVSNHTFTYNNNNNSNQHSNVNNSDYGYQNRAIVTTATSHIDDRYGDDDDEQHNSSRIINDHSTTSIPRFSASAATARPHKSVTTAPINLTEYQSQQHIPQPPSTTESQQPQQQRASPASSFLPTIEQPKSNANTKNKAVIVAASTAVATPLAPSLSDLPSPIAKRGVFATSSATTTTSTAFQQQQQQQKLVSDPSLLSSQQQQQQQKQYVPAPPPPPVMLVPKARSSKLELEVQRLEAAGTLLVQRPGEEIAGLILLEKAIASRTRFPVLASEIWRRAEQLVVLCCQIVFRLMQQCDESSLLRSKEVLRVAERILNPPPPLATHSTQPLAEPFDGFDVLKRSLLASTRVAYAVVLSEMNEHPETIVAVLETALQTEQPRPSAATLYNLAVAYVNAGKFDDAAACVLRCIDLVSHYTSMHLNLTRETEPPYRCFIQENATYSILCHHLVASIGTWCNLPQLTLQHSILALRCAERCLGTQHALTARCAQYVRSLEMTRMSLGPNSFAVMSTSMRATQELLSQSLGARRDAHGAPPTIPFQMSSFSSEFLPSLLIPFSLVQPHPITFDLPAEAYRRPAPPLLIAREPVKGLDATTARKMTNEALKSAKASTLTNVPQPPGAAARRYIHHHQQQQQEKKKKKIQQVQQQQQQRGAQQVDEDQHAGDQEHKQDQGQQALRYLSVIPLRDFDLYQKIQQEVAGLVSNTERFVSGEINKRRAEQVSLLRLPYVPSNAVTNRYDQSYKKLREMSYLKPDHTLADEEIWNQAAYRLQNFMRRFVADLKVCRRQMAVEHLIRRHMAADSISEAWRLYKLCRAAKRRLRFLRQKKSELDCLVMTQSYLRFHQSIESYAGWYLKYLQRKLWEKQHFKQRQLAAGLIQAVWRSHDARSKLRFIIGSAVKIQRFSRKFRLYIEMRLVVFRRRQRRRAFYCSLHGSASKIQHWFRSQIPRVHALREMRRRQRLRDEAYQTMYDAEWLKYVSFRDADENTCARRIVRFFRRCIWRRNEAERQRRSNLRHAAATMVRRSFLRYKCRKLRIRVQQENEYQLRILQRKEEVREAARDLQRYGRGLLGRASVYGNLRKQAQEEVAARRIQRFALLLHAKVQKRQLAERRSFEAARYEIAALRFVSTLAIQCAWRRFVAKKFVRGYATFMGEGRNGIARKIQRCFRQHRAHLRFSVMARQRRETQIAEQQTQVRDCAAKRIQRAFRSNLQRRLGRKFAVATVIELSRLRSAAEVIQRRWRCTFARLQRFALQQERDAQIERWRGEEHRVVSAIVLQRWVRSRILIRKQIEDAKPGHHRRMAQRIQCMVRSFFARRKIRQLQICRDALSAQESVVRDQHHAAIIIQRNERMRQARNGYRLRLDAAKVIRDSWHAIFVKTQLKTARIMADYEAYLQSTKDEENQNHEQEL